MDQRSDYHFDLPSELIAQYPADRRDASRMLVIERKSGAYQDRQFSDIVQFIHPEDVLVINTTKVIPARLFGQKETGAKVELFLLGPAANGDWSALIKPAKRIREGQQIQIENCLVTVTSRGNEGGFRVQFPADLDVDAFLEDHGRQPLPPYIQRDAEDLDRERYQTVYAAEKGAVAAPTAGLHFTDEILSTLRLQGTEILNITLHVGLGTFRPVTADRISDHRMHREYYKIPAHTAERINAVKQQGRGRVIAVGTTSMRTMESAHVNGVLQAGANETDIFIYPGFQFHMVDALLTNFHTPESTLLMLVSAFAGYDAIMAAYQHAVAERYRFFSYGDCMLIG